MRSIRLSIWAELQNIPNWRTVVQTLPPQGCLLVTRLDNQPYNREIHRLAKMLTEQGVQVFWCRWMIRLRPQTEFQSVDKGARIPPDTLSSQPLRPSATSQDRGRWLNEYSLKIRDANPTQMISESDYLNHIHQAFPNLDLQDVHINREGMVNVSVIVNRERVFRFPRAEWGVALLQQEMNALDLMRQYVDIPVPQWDYRSDEMISYPFIPGDPLLTDDLLRMDEREKDAVAELLAKFLKQMHSIPLDKVDAAAIQHSETVRTLEEQLQFYEDVKTFLFPLMWADGREWVRRLFVPFLEDHTFLDYRPAFMNGDLGVYHLLFDRQTNQLNGIIDFGTAGIGDPAQDFGIIINQYGESFLRRMSHIYPGIVEYIDRARFYAGRIELEWILRGIREEAEDMFVVHIGRARDVMPVGSDWQ